MYDVIVNATDIQPDELQENVFFWAEGDPCPQPAQLKASDLEPCSYLKGYDYFEVRNYKKKKKNYKKIKKNKKMNRA